MHFTCGQLSIALDNGNGDISFVSHAHSDHLNGVMRKEQIIASEETIALAKLKGINSKLDNVRLANAGHILGARQLVVSEDGKKSVYTGDLCIRDSLTTKGAEIIECDKLIIEATYAEPHYKFPNYEEVCGEMERWVKNRQNSSNILFGCYELGKAQELVKFFNEYCGVARLVNEKMEEFCKVYDKFGLKLDRIMIGSDEAEEVMKRPFVALVPMRNGKRYFAKRIAEAFNRETLACITTGWAMKYGFNVDKAFPLSDHADHYDLKHYIEQSGAKEIEFFAGDGLHLLKSIKNARTQLF